MWVPRVGSRLHVFGCSMAACRLDGMLSAWVERAVLPRHDCTALQRLCIVLHCTRCTSQAGGQAAAAAGSLELPQLPCVALQGTITCPTPLRLPIQVKLVGKQRLVLDLSCRKKEDGQYYVVTDRWQKFSSLALRCVAARPGRCTACCWRVSAVETKRLLHEARCANHLCGCPHSHAMRGHVPLMCRPNVPPHVPPHVPAHVHLMPSSPRSEATLAYLAESCDEFLVHGVDVEGMQASGAGEGSWAVGLWGQRPHGSARVLLLVPGQRVERKQARAY